VLYLAQPCAGLDPELLDQLPAREPLRLRLRELEIISARPFILGARVVTG
jgi:hypothetical protein